MLEPDNVVIPSPRVAYRQIGDQVVVVDPVDNRLLTLNETGSAAWLALDGRTVGEVASRIAQQFEVDPETAVADVKHLLQGLLDRGLVTRREG